MLSQPFYNYYYLSKFIIMIISITFWVILFSHLSYNSYYETWKKMCFSLDKVIVTSKAQRKGRKKRLLMSYERKPNLSNLKQKLKRTWYRMCIQLASLGPGTCFKITPHFSNSLKTKFVSDGENLEIKKNSIIGPQWNKCLYKTNKK